MAIEKHRLGLIARRKNWIAALGLVAFGACSTVMGGQIVLAQTIIPKTRSVTDIAKTPSAVTPDPQVAPAPTIDPQKPAAPSPEPTSSPKRSPATPAVATGIAVTVQGATTRVTVALTAAADVQIFTLAEPNRLIIDAADLDFALPASLGRQSAGLVQALRFGLIAPGRSRIVIDLSGPASITDNRTAVARAPGVVQLVLLLSPTSPDTFAASVNRPPPLSPAAPDASWQPSVKKAENSKPVVVIDPGHGGIDGGAVGADNVVEKDLVLAVARQLRQMLQGTGRYDVRMTRTADSFISLDQRVQFSKAAEAALFVSLHADSVADVIAARTAHGATVYTLAETATNRAAQRLADKENAADARVGVVTDQASDTAQISSILNDLLHRETQNFSMQFKKMIVERLGRERLLARDPTRAAAFKVLRQSNTPSVLIELGFITNAEEAQAMQTAAWQQKVARAITTAIDTFFDSQKPK